ncbi:MAG: ArsA family ATPase [Moraxellaceae bacterium]|nr:ArsA family ATPase [Moraxellaceae bacterium]
MKLFDNLLEKQVIFVGGKGGVGKTTCSSALAVYFANLGRKTLIISTDPAHSLGDALAIKLSHKKTKINENLDAIELNSEVIVHQHFSQVEKTLQAYTNPDMMPKLREFLKLSHHAPGAEEAGMLEAICRHLVEAKNDYQHIIFDTAPTGHTLRLLELPEMMQAWTDGLLAQQRRQKKLREASQNLDNQRNFNPFVKENDRWQKAVSVLEKRRQLFTQARDILHNPRQTAIVLVLIAETLPIAETKRALQQLQANHLPCQGLIINQVLDEQQPNEFWQKRRARQQEIIRQLDYFPKNLEKVFVPLKQNDIQGVSVLAEFWQEATPLP